MAALTPPSAVSVYEPSICGIDTVGELDWLALSPHRQDLRISERAPLISVAPVSAHPVNRGASSRSSPLLARRRAAR
jgi:hypothetical protein